MESLVFGYDGDPRLRTCYERLFEAEQKTRSRNLLMNSVLYKYLFLLADKFPHRRSSGAEKRSNYVEEALDFMEGVLWSCGDTLLQINYKREEFCEEVKVAGKQRLP